MRFTTSILNSRIHVKPSVTSWGFTPDPTKGYPPLDPDQRALDQVRFVRYAVKPTDQLAIFVNHGEGAGFIFMSDGVGGFFLARSTSAIT